MKRLMVSAFLMMALPANAHAGVALGVFADSCSSSDLTVLTGANFTLSICAHLDGQPDPEQCLDPFLAVRCRVTGIPDSWEVVVTPNPEAGQVLGNPLEAAGGDIVISLDGSPAPRSFSTRWH